MPLGFVITIALGKYLGAKKIPRFCKLLKSDEKID
jgi:hypothetical protein